MVKRSSIFEKEANIWLTIFLNIFFFFLFLFCWFLIHFFYFFSLFLYFIIIILFVYWLCLSQVKRFWCSLMPMEVDLEIQHHWQVVEKFSLFINAFRSDFVVQICHLIHQIDGIFSVSSIKYSNILSVKWMLSVF